MANTKGAVKPKSSKQEVEQRIAHLRKLIVTCEFNADTADEIRERLAAEWDVSERMVSHYAQFARTQIDAVHFIDPRDLKAHQQMAMMRAEYTSRQALLAGDFRAAVEAQKLWCQIAGVDELARRADARDEARAGRDVEKHARDMRDGPQPSSGPAVQVIVNRGAVDDDGVPVPDDTCSKST